MAQDVQLLHNLGRDLANSRAWPNWSQDSEFRATRDQTAGERTGAAPATPAAQPADGERG
jgi:hypothetical protein